MTAFGFSLSSASRHSIAIRRARGVDRPAIRSVYQESPNPHRRRVRIGDYYVAAAGKDIVGCAAVRAVDGWGYLYGLAVKRTWRRRGIGSALISARLHWLHTHQFPCAILLTMFWNIRFFRRLGFHPQPKRDLPGSLLRLPDLRDAMNHRCTAMIVLLSEVDTPA